MDSSLKDMKAALWMVSPLANVGFCGDAIGLPMSEVGVLGAVSRVRPSISPSSPGTCEVLSGESWRVLLRRSASPDMLAIGSLKVGVVGCVE